MRRAAVLGSPIAHSLSPVLHGAAYRELGLDWSYDAHEVGVDDLKAFVDGLGPEWVGLSLTMPLKRAVLPLCDVVTREAAAVEAVNTLTFVAGRRHGTNTDIPGIVAALSEGSPSGIARPADSDRPAHDGLARDDGAVIGGGATALSAVAALADLGVSEPLVLVRRPEVAEDLLAVAERLGSRPQVRRWDHALDALRKPLVISTVPGEAAATLAGAVPQSPGLLFDVVYDPWPTTLAAVWDARGGPVIGGLDLLVHQAVLQVELMTGTSLDRGRLVAVMRHAGQRALAVRRG